MRNQEEKSGQKIRFLSTAVLPARKWGHSFRITENITSRRFRGLYSAPLLPARQREAVL
jgi:hypothetical protein